MPPTILAPDSVHRARLANGLTVLVRRDASAPVVAIVTWVRAGYFDETDDIVGIAHVLEHMYFKGTEARGVGEISRQTKAAGGYLNAGTIYDHTSYYTVLPASSFQRGLDIQADAYVDSVIDASELARELEVIIQEAKRKADNPSAVAVESLYELLHDRHRMRRWRIGREDGLRRLTRTDVLRFYRTLYQPSETILTIVGDVDPDLAVRSVEERYGGLEDGTVARDRGPAEPPTADFRFRDIAADVTQTQIAFGWRTPGTLHPDTALLDVAAVVLASGRASRLYRNVRERRLAASVTAHDYTPTELGVFTIHAEGPPDRAADAARAIWAEVDRLREDGVRPDEIERARQLFEARWIRRLETMEGQANYLAEWESLGDWVLGDEYLQQLVSATPAKVTDAVRRHLVPDRAGLVVLRPGTAMPFAADAPAARALLDAARGSAPRLPTPMAAPAVIASRAKLATFDREEAGIAVFRTEAGVPVLVERRGSVPLVHLGVHFAGGAHEEPADTAGLTSLLVRTAIKGTATRSAAQIAEEAELLGGSIGASVGAESFGWGISVPSTRIEPAMTLLADVVQSPTIPDAALDTERTLALADLALLRDDMQRYPLRLLGEAAFPNHPYGVPASGTEESLPRIDAAAVREWHASHALSGATVIVVVGDVVPDEAADLAARVLGSLSVRPAASLAAPSWPREAVARVEMRQKEQTALALAFPSPTRTDDRRFAARLLAGVASGLGGRFFDELRDRRSLAYTVSAFSSERREAGLFVSYIATSPEREEEARRGLLDQFARLREEPVTAAELEQARAYALGTHAIRQQSGAAVLGDIVDAWMFGRGLVELTEYDERIRSVTADDILSLARQYFDEERVVEAVVRAGNS